MANKILTIENTGNSSISLDTFRGLIYLKAADTAIIEVTELQYTIISGLSNISILSEIGQFFTETNPGYVNIANANLQVGDVDVGAENPVPVSDLVLRDLIGEVAASPADNTLLARIKSLEDKIEAFTDNGKVVTELSGSNIANETDKVTAVATDIIADYTATKTMNTTLMIMTGTAGTLSLEVDGKLGTLNGGVALDTGKWYAFDVPVLATSVYNLQFSAIATMQIKWIGGF